eukprot:1133671-Pelagomonas_calceolata.AAC.8
MLRTHLRNAGVGRGSTGGLRGFHRGSTSSSFVNSRTHARGDVLVVQARKANAGWNTAAQSALGTRKGKRGAARGREVRGGMFRACHISSHRVPRHTQ